MTWNHRVIHNTLSYEHQGETITEEKYYIGEVYYNEDNKITSYGEAFAPQGETLEGLKADIARHLKACDLPVLHEVDLDNKLTPIS